MIQLSSPWTRGMRPFNVGLALGQTPLPMVAPSGSSSKAGSGALAVGAGLLTLGVASVGVLFSYGIARESKSKLVKATGYVLAGVGAIAALIEAGAVAVAVSNA